MARDEKLEMLRRIPLFSGFSRSQLQRLAALADEVNVPAGKVLMRQGEFGSEMMLLITGHAVVDRDGARIDTLHAGDFFGEIAIIQEGERTATVTAEGPARLLVVTHRDFHSIMEEFPEVAVQVMATLANRIRTLEPRAAH